MTATIHRIFRELNPEHVFSRHGFSMDDYNRVVRVLDVYGLQIQRRSAVHRPYNEIPHILRDKDVICPSEAAMTLWDIMRDLNINHSLDVCENLIKELLKQKHEISFIDDPGLRLRAAPGSAAQYYMIGKGWVDASTCIDFYCAHEMLDEKRPSPCQVIPFSRLSRQSPQTPS